VSAKEEVFAMVRPDIAMEAHPDILEMRARYDRVALTATAQFIDGATLLAGVYLAISPWVIGFRPAGRDLATNDLICGIAVALLALGYATAFGRTHGLAWVAPVIGIWTIVSPWVILGGDAAGGTILSNVICGAVITLLGLAALTMGGQRANASRTSR
jgi:SPW repeat